MMKQLLTYDETTVNLWWNHC